ncbi:MAG: MBL fold metallo-hydrolase [Polymorphobacter sp.]
MLTRRGMMAAGLALAAAPGAAATGKSRLILLGTAGGPTPKPNRAAAAQVIIVDGAAYVIDCGNGTPRQLVLAGVPLRSLRGIFITHMHSDHVADLGNLQWLAWSDNLITPVDSYGPPPLARMQRQFLAMNSADITTRIKDEGRPPLAPLMRSHEITRPGLVLNDGRVRVTAALVDHPPVVPSFAYRFDCPDRSIVISGDTSASPALVELARGADVLVHEIMLESAIEGLVRNAPDAKTLRQHLLASHSTGEQVGRAATAAGVKILVLSHFVPGGAPFIADDVWLAAVRPHFAGNIVVGRDLLEL